MRTASHARLHPGDCSSSCTELDYEFLLTNLDEFPSLYFLFKVQTLVVTIKKTQESTPIISVKCQKRRTEDKDNTKDVFTSLPHHFERPPVLDEKKRLNVIRRSGVVFLKTNSGCVWLTGCIPISRI